ncbi:Sulfotransferase domain protein [Rubripirellula amarantea]|uniref:Sulfotransferase domain protein n=1 Tax=Rubripirellula amarantea TaxID=2527999 RepID=A0A5C5WG71_9BACT|nr:sulfotransferase domain-containing protein [Rubripirellula amarantea]TWT49650.1 Sulfotransferase domain protein [Rubripirellula amarantea]
MSGTSVQPNFFIAGAPKCGTTAIASYLRTHPNVFISEPKEPTFWASDMPKLSSQIGINTLADYERLFANASGKAAVGEGSTMYLYSENALPDAYAYNPNAKFVFAFRCPAEVAHAYHMQMCFYEQENEDNFSTAWQLQDARLSDDTLIPNRCLSKKLLQYRYVAALGSQIERALTIIPREQIHFVVLDDFAHDPLKCYQNLLRFLELPDDGRTEFPKQNAAMKAKSRVVTRVLRSRAVREITFWAKGKLNGKAFDFAKQLKNRAMFVNAPRDELDDAFRLELHRYFEPEVAKLETVLGRSLATWNNPRAKSTN